MSEQSLQKNQSLDQDLSVYLEETKRIIEEKVLLDKKIEETKNAEEKAALEARAQELEKETSERSDVIKEIVTTSSKLIAMGCIGIESYNDVHCVFPLPEHVAALQVLTANFNEETLENLCDIIDSREIIGRSDTVIYATGVMVNGSAFEEYSQHLPQYKNYSVEKTLEFCQVVNKVMKEQDPGLNAKMMPAIYVEDEIQNADKLKEHIKESVEKGSYNSEGQGILNWIIKNNGEFAIASWERDALAVGTTKSTAQPSVPTAAADSALSKMNEHVEKYEDPSSKANKSRRGADGPETR